MPITTSKQPNKKASLKRHKDELGVYAWTFKYEEPKTESQNLLVTEETSEVKPVSKYTEKQLFDMTFKQQKEIIESIDPKIKIPAKEKDRVDLILRIV